MPFRYLEEIATADVAFEASGKSEEELFLAAAAAVLATMTAAPEKVARRRKLVIRLEEEEFELLLYAFLQELIFYKDARRLLLHADSAAISRGPAGFSLEARVSGELINPGRHRLLVDVKAVTLHLYQVAFRDGVWLATVVLDV